MAKRETIYVVDKATDTIIRASRNYTNALQYTLQLKMGTFYVCTSEFGTLKKGDPMSNVTYYLA